MNDMGDDSIDARIADSHQNPTVKQTFGHLNIPVDSLTYDMTHSQRGKCLVFNHQNFDPQTGCKPRSGTENDATAIVRCFYNLDFNIVQFNDASFRDIRDSLTRVSKEDHSDRDCIAIVILSHGDEDSLWARDAKYPINTIFNIFKGDQCPTLAGKPKIFIIQACRGHLLDSGVKIMANGMDVVDGPQPVYRIPTISDFLIYYSTAPGHYSFRNTTNGSYFIQTLASVLQRYCRKYQIDLLTLFTIVNQEVAYGFQSYVPKTEYHEKKQIPCIASMLTRLVFLTPKPIKN